MSDTILHERQKTMLSLDTRAESCLSSLNISRNASPVSVVSSIGKTPKGSVRYKWSSKWEIIVLQLACFVTVESFFVIPIDLFTDDPTTVLHYAFFYTAIGIPVVYMQVVVGQYSQLGVLFFKYLTPIGHGIGYLMCINTFWGCIYQGVNMGDISLYFLSSLESELPWMKCPETHDTCWVTNKNCTTNCLTSEKKLSAFVFWSKVHMNNIDLNATSLRYSAPILSRVVVVGIAWVTVYFLTRMRISKYRRIVTVNLYLATVLCTLLVFVCILTQGGSKGLYLFISSEWSNLLHLEAWTSAVIGGIKLLGLGRACYVVYGSYMDFKTPSHILVIVYVCFNLFWMLFGCVLVFAGIGIIADESNTPVEKLKHFFYEPMPQLILLPQSLGYLGAAQLWSSVYFLLCLLLLVNHQVTQVEIVERCITDLNYHFKHYSDYILAALCLTGVFCGIALVSKDAFLICSALTTYVVYPTKVFTVTIMCTLICWVYGVQNFSDDIHFMIGVQPAKYWKILWYMIPVILWIGLIYTEYNLKSTSFLTLLFIFGIIYICPLLIMAITAIFHHLKNHNLVGVVQAQERWGPPDPEERQLRHLFNPREETRSRRRNQFCTHKCFLKSKVLHQAVEEQASFRNSGNNNIKVDESSDDESESD